MGEVSLTGNLLGIMGCPRVRGLRPYRAGIFQMRRYLESHQLSLPTFIAR